jgi:hypothetical protein
MLQVSSSSFPDVQLHIVDAPLWRRPGIHTPDRGYGFRVRSPSAKLMRASILSQGSRLGTTKETTPSQLIRR